jgi:F-type H+-transporting ATPase subunit a
MEHHYYFIVEILSRLGLGHFAHEWAHVLHSWLVMIILIWVYLLKKCSAHPPKKNFLEMIVEGLELHG